MQVRETRTNQELNQFTSDLQSRLKSKLGQRELEEQTKAALEATLDLDHGSDQKPDASGEAQLSTLASTLQWFAKDKSSEKGSLNFFTSKGVSEKADLLSEENLFKTLDHLISLHKADGNPIINTAFNSAQPVPLASFKAEHVAPAIAYAYSEASKELAQIDSQPSDFKSFRQLIEAKDTFYNTWQLLYASGFINEFEGLSKQLKTVVQQFQSKFEFNSAQLANQMAKHIKASVAFASLEPPEKKYIDEILETAQSQGADIKDETIKKQYQALSSQIGKLKKEFVDNRGAARNSYAVFVTDDKELAGLPQNAQDTAAKTLEKLKTQNLNARASQKQDPYKIPFDAKYAFNNGDPIELAPPVMLFAKNEALRKELYANLAQIAANGGKHDNKKILVDWFKAKEAKAKLVDLKVPADMEMHGLTLDNAESAFKFLEDLTIGKGLTKKARQEFEGLRQEKLRLVKEEGYECENLEKVEIHDFAFLQESKRNQILKEAGSSIKELSEYLPVKAVVEHGLFYVGKEFFGLDFDPVNKPEIVVGAGSKVFAIKKNDQVLAYMSLDPFARKGKNPGPGYNVRIVRPPVRKDSSRVPQTVLGMNFPAPGHKLSLREMQIIFHEFGHFVQISSNQDFRRIKTDALEAPSQFMEEFAYDPDVLKNISRHSSQGEMSDQLCEKVSEAARFGKAMELIRRVEIGSLALLSHMKKDAYGNDYAEYSEDYINKLWKSICDRFSALPYEGRENYPWSSIHLVGYGTPAYNYVWGAPLAAQLFTKLGPKPLKSALGQKLIDKVYKPGGSYPFEALVDAFIHDREVDPNFSTKDFEHDLGPLAELYNLNFAAN